MAHSTCYLSDDFSKQEIPKDVIICPEMLKNSEAIKEWVDWIKIHPQKFATCSLFLLRELYIQDVNVYYINITKDGIKESFNVDDIGNIEILDRELAQSDVYINKDQ